MTTPTTHTFNDIDQLRAKFERELVRRRTTRDEAEANLVAVEEAAASVTQALAAHPAVPLPSIRPGLAERVTVAAVGVAALGSSAVAYAVPDRSSPLAPMVVAAVAVVVCGAVLAGWSLAKAILPDSRRAWRAAVAAAAGVSGVCVHAIQGWWVSGVAGVLAVLVGGWFAAGLTCQVHRRRMVLLVELAEAEALVEACRQLLEQALSAVAHVEHEVLRLGGSLPDEHRAYPVPRKSVSPL